MYACTIRRVRHHRHLAAVIYQVTVRRAAVHEQQHRLMSPAADERQEDLVPLLQERCHVRPCIGLREVIERMNPHYRGLWRVRTRTMSGDPPLVRVPHYIGFCLCHENSPALYRTPALYNPHYTGTSTIAKSLEYEKLPQKKKNSNFFIHPVRRILLLLSHPRPVGRTRSRPPNS